VKVNYGGKAFLAIKVPEFGFAPVVCSRESNDFLRGSIYIRPVGKAESRPIRTAAELHDLLDLAAEKRARKFLEMAGRLGMKLPDDDAAAFDKELDDL
jgi:hypothetical protein